MKAFKILTSLCFIMALTSGSSYCQTQRGEYEWIFGSGSVLPCIGEELEGTITVEWSMNKFTYHERGRGILTGTTSGDEYLVSYEYNREFIWHKIMVYGVSFPMLIKHDGKLVAIIHESYRGIAFTEEGGPSIVDRYVYDVECK
jgi:hypothetical protein